MRQHDNQDTLRWILDVDAVHCFVDDSDELICGFDCHDVHVLMAVTTVKRQEERCRQGRCRMLQAV
jgi:hypothetical protein